MDKNGKQWISPHDGSQYALIGTDKNDIIYIARLSGAQASASTGKNSSETGSRLADMILAGGLNGDFHAAAAGGPALPGGLHHGHL